MSGWHGKFVIGLTGNIATGKSVVRKMLEHLGAYSIDADALSHRAMAKGAPAYKPVVALFGQWLLDENQEIDRKRLGEIVFNSEDAMQKLEAVVHPYVRQAIDVLIKRSKHEVVVIEAIKLLEGDLAEKCDLIWVTDAPEPLQITRLMNRRGLSDSQARERIYAQNDQKDKVNAADVVIDNSGSFEDLWKQVSAGWHNIKKEDGAQLEEQAEETTSGEFKVKRGNPKHSEEIAALMTRLAQIEMNADDVMVAFGEKAFFILEQDEKLVGLAGWQIENLVTSVTDLYVNDNIAQEEGIKALVEEIEKASKSLQSEASLLFVETERMGQSLVWKELGYSKHTPQSLGVQAWQDAAKEKLTPDKTLFFKQLRMDRVLLPI